MKQSSIFKTRNITEKLKDLQYGDTLWLELQKDVSGLTAMKSITSTACRLGIKITQKFYRVCGQNYDDNTLHNVIRITKELD